MGPTYPRSGAVTRAAPPPILVEIAFWSVAFLFALAAIAAMTFLLDWGVTFLVILAVVLFA